MHETLWLSCSLHQVTETLSSDRKFSAIGRMSYEKTPLKHTDEKYRRTSISPVAEFKNPLRTTGLQKLLLLFHSYLIHLLSCKYFGKNFPDWTPPKQCILEEGWRMLSVYYWNSYKRTSRDKTGTFPLLSWSWQGQPSAERHSTALGTPASTRTRKQECLWCRRPSTRGTASSPVCRQQHEQENSGTWVYRSPQTGAGTAF